jgi:transcriptional regulator with XRE-family HTH domain
MDFREMQQRFVGFLRERVRSGQLTERGLARITGVSQPHIHNVLNGKRLFSIEMSDQILSRLHLDLWDLIRPEDLSDRQRKH